MKISWIVCATLTLVCSLHANADEYTLRQLNGDIVGAIELESVGNRVFIVKALATSDEYRKSRFYDPAFETVAGHSLQRPFFTKVYSTKYLGTVNVMGLPVKASFEITLEPYVSAKLAPDNKWGAQWLMEIWITRAPGFAHVLRVLLVKQSA